MLSVARFVAILILFALPLRSFAAPPMIDYASTDWSGAALLSAKIKGHSLRGPVTMDLAFGPLASPTLADGEFSIQLDDGTASLPLRGTFAVDAKGRPQLSIDTTTLAADFQKLLVDFCFDKVNDPGCDIFNQVDVVIDPSQLKLKITGKEIRGVVALYAQGKLPFVLSDQGTGRPLAKVLIGFKSAALTH